MSYSSRYQEIKIIGRGNFGAAYLVQKLDTGENLVAKKILLTGMSEREIQGAYLEAELLKRLDHPNIVRYKDSYCEGGFLIIVMENCEVGDLSYHVKMKNKENAFFTEAEIMNWFVQICMALQYIHSLGILHRDIKSSNIYLTSNNTVKLGDFGISKVLQGSEAAMTVVGTPYYMSPEVCEGKPYSYKSDAWSLGCVLYELCTLKHAFSADNLLGLVFKIVSGTAEPIPNRYSPQLRRITASMLAKDTNSRLSVQDVIRDPYVLQFMQGFVETAGQEMKRQFTHRKLESPAKAPIRKEEIVHESPKERMARLKKEKADEEFEKMKRATRDAFNDNRITQQRKYDMLYSTPSTRGLNEPARSTAPEFSQSGSTIASIAFTNRKSTEKDINFELSMTDMQDLNSQANYEAYLRYTGEAPEMEDTLNYSDTFESCGLTGGLAGSLGTGGARNDERAIKAAGYYDLSTVNEAGSLSECSERQELTQVVDLYKNQIERTMRQDVETVNSPCDPTDRVIVGDKKSAMRKKCMDQMGESNFEQVYEFLSTARSRDIPDDVIREQALKRWGKAANNYCLLVDQLIFIERY